MPNAPVQFADSDVRVDGVVVAKVTGIEHGIEGTPVDTTGTEDVSGNLVQTQRVIVAVDETYSVSGHYVSGDGESPATRQEPGQTALETAVRAGTAVVLRVLDQNDFGDDATCVVSNYRRTGQLRGVWQFTANFLVNTTTPVTP